MKYDFNVIKEISVTDSFVSLDEEIRGCQEELTFNECITRKFRNTMISKCHCLPLQMGFTEEVGKSISKSYRGMQ